jgi:thiamine kinase-like enzyme
MDNTTITPVLLHGDLTGDNILLTTEKNLMMLDFDRACIGDPAFDLFRIVQTFGFEIYQQAREYLGFNDETLHTRVLFYLMCECAKYLEYDPKKYGLYQAQLAQAAKISLDVLFSAKSVWIIDFKGLLSNSASDSLQNSINFKEFVGIPWQKLRF